MKRRNEEPEAQQFANNDGVRVWRARRVPPRRPAGTALVKYKSGAKSCMRMTVDARFVSPSERLMAKHLRDLVVQVERATLAPHAIGVETLQALESAYSAAVPWPDWFPWFFECLEQVRIVWFHLETAGRIGPDDALEAGRAVIRCTRAALSEAIVFCPLLPWWMAPELVALLVQRFSFGRGGGPDRALSRDRMRDLLLHPPKMAAYLRSIEGGEKRFSRVLAGLDRDVPDDLLEPCEVEAVELAPTIQHTLKAEYLRSLADEVENACGDPPFLLLPERLDALHRAHAAISSS